MRLSRSAKRLIWGAAAILGLVGSATMILRWNLLCANSAVWTDINDVCSGHMSGESVGNLCPPLCVLDEVHSISCHPTQSPRSETTFVANWNNRKMLFKSPKKNTLLDPDALFWIDEKNQRHYPSRDDFRNMIKELVILKLNVSISDQKAEDLGGLPKDDEIHIDDNDASRRAAEMDNVWALLQDSDYLLTMVFSEAGIFPKKIGNCGPLFAVEHAEPLKGPSALFSLEEDEAEWNRRCRVAVLILELIEKFEKVNLRICDIDLSHFGSSGGKLRYIDLNGIRQKGNPCYPGEKGNRDNLQAVCERIYLGWIVRGRIVVPGLLVSRKAPTALSVLLRRCADPSAPTPSKSLKRALYNNLIKRN